MWNSEYESNYLAHHGILGQKWGVRRFQNPDGSLTAKGKKRYSDGRNLASDERRKIKEEYNEEMDKRTASASESFKRYQKWEKGNISINGKTFTLEDWDLAEEEVFKMFDEAEKQSKDYINSKYDIDFDKLVKREARQITLGATAVGAAAIMGYVAFKSK